MSESTEKHEDANQASGQAMVEFVIILIIVMAVCAGMCASIRLLTYQFWARQEARFLAFERVWSADDFYTAGNGDPESLLSSGNDIGRPQIVTQRQNTRSTNNDGTVTQLLSWLFAPAEEGLGPLPLEVQKGSQSILLARTTPGEMFSWIGTAFARQDGGEGEPIGLDDIPNPRSPGFLGHPSPTGSKEKIGRAFENILDQQGFGPKFCSLVSNRAEQEGLHSAAAEFRTPDCGRKMNEDFGLHLGENLDFTELFEDYGQRIEWGDAPDEAFERSIRRSVGQQFYSFFDTLVRTSRVLAFPTLISEAGNAMSTLADSNVARMLSDLRYVGSSIALAGITAGGASFLGQLNTTNADQVLQNERNFLINVLHVDQVESLGGVPFFLSPLYLPVPPTFGATAPAFQEAAMKNLLFEDSGLVTQLIDQSNKRIQVTYKAAGGLFPAATRRFAGIEDVELTSNYYIIGQPWHITRRISPTGAYRDKGTETDDIDDNTEEGVLRRRVSGLWLFPSNVFAFLQPVSALPGLGFLSGVFQAFEPIGSLIGEVKSFILVDNPIFQILDALSDLPGIGALIPTVPKWPAVRPDAYVGSEEMTGNSAGSPDKLMGEERNFSDYLQEQRDFNPPPEPTFN